MAGADGLTVLPFDAPVVPDGGSVGPVGRRMARNTQLLLLEEASLHRVADPAGGSWYVESLTDQLARGAWAQLQELERSGGIAAALSSGEVGRQVAAATTRRHDELSRRRRALTGVNTFPLLGDDGLERAGAPTDADALVAVPETVPDDVGLTPVRDAAQFEALRARAIRIATEREREPTILLPAWGRCRPTSRSPNGPRASSRPAASPRCPAGVRSDHAAQASLLREADLTVVAVCPGRGAEPEAQRELVGALRQAGAEAVYVRRSHPGRRRNGRRRCRRARRGSTWSRCSASC